MRRERRGTAFKKSPFKNVKIPYKEIGVADINFSDIFKPLQAAMGSTREKKRCTERDEPNACISCRCHILILMERLRPNSCEYAKATNVMNEPVWAVYSKGTTKRRKCRHTAKLI